MGFLFPGLLALGAIASVPIVIHLLNRQRYKHVRWAAMKFLYDAMREETRRIQYKDWLLMALRALACLLLVLAIARPVSRTLDLSVMGEGRRAAVIVIDNSASMRRISGSETLLALAKRRALALVGELPPQTPVSVIEATRPATVLLAHSTDRHHVETVIEEMFQSDGGTDVVGSLRKTEEIFRTNPTVSGRNVFIFSDLQQTVWRRDAASALRQVQAMEEGTRCFAIQVGVEGAENLAVVDLETDFHEVTVAEPFEVRVTVMNGGTESASDVTVDVMMGETQVASRIVDVLEPGGTSKQTFLIEADSPGEHVVSAVVDRGRGRLAVDDTRRMVVTAVEQVEALLVDGEPGDRFGEGEVDYLDAVLAPDLGTDSEVLADEDQIATGPFKVTKLPGDELGLEDIQDADVIVLGNVPFIRDDVARALDRRVRDGAGLVVFLGEKIQPEAYTELFEKAVPANGTHKKGKAVVQAEKELGTSGKKADEKSAVETLLPAAVGEKLVDETDVAKDEDEDTDLYLSPEYLDHEWMRFFRQKKYKDYLRVPVKQAWALDLKDRDDTHIVARYSTGAPAIVEKRVGEGRVVLIGTTADLDWNQWFTEQLGPILFKRIVMAVIPAMATSKSADVGRQVRIRLPATERKVGIKLLSPDDQLKTVQPEMANGKVAMVFEGQRLAGTYRVRIDTAPPREELFALNVETDESDLRALTPDDLSDLFPDGEIRLVSEESEAELSSILRGKRLGSELWWPVLFLALMIFIGELLLGRWFTKEAPTADALPRIARLGRRVGPAGAAVARGTKVEDEVHV